MTQKTSDTPRQKGEQVQRTSEPSEKHSCWLRRHARYLKAGLAVSATATVTWTHWHHLMLEEPSLVTAVLAAATVVVAAAEVPAFCTKLSMILSFCATLIRNIGKWRIWEKLSFKTD